MDLHGFHYWAPRIIGGVLGLAFVGYFFVYVPMMENIERNGCPFLECPTD